MMNDPSASRPPTYQPATHRAQPSRGAPWLTLFVADAVISLVTFAVFGVFGGLVLLVGLNGFDGRTGGMIMVVYGVVVLAGNALVACLVNWMILRIRAAVGARAVLLPAVATTAVTLFVGPPLAVVIIKLLFGGRTY